MSSRPADRHGIVTIGAARRWYVRARAVRHHAEKAMILVARHHALGLAKARRLAESIARQLHDSYGGSYTWKGNDLHFQRTGASGSVTVTKDEFEVRVELGFLLSPLSARIEREIQTFCDEHLGKDGSAAPPRSEAPRRSARPR
jgi:putative polyhydroxyalkanoate system protein